MVSRNKELRRGMWALGAVTLVLTLAGWRASPVCGAFVLLACGISFGVYSVTEGCRYQALKKLSRDLDHLLLTGTPLPIGQYEEGELSILACQIQKMALGLTEAADTVKGEKAHLAQSLADISHQLRTPLTSMNLTAAMLGSRELSQQRRLELVRELQGLLSRTDWLVESLLKLSKLDAGMVELAKEQVPIKGLIARACEPLAIPMELREQHLTVRCGEERFTGDLVWSSEALGNLLKNCMEHTPQGGRVTVAAWETPLFTQITVEDTGPGFDPKDIPHLFERFYKGTNASQDSWGIGLALARTVITAQNGTLQAMNGDTGARFVIKFYKQVI